MPPCRSNDYSPDEKCGIIPQISSKEPVRKETCPVRINKTLSISVFAVTACLMMAGSSLAYTITKELQQEINVNLASVEAYPNDPHAHFDLAITYAYTNHVQEGWDELKVVHELDGNYAKEALASYSQLVKDSPDDWKIRFRLAFVLYFLDRKSDAINEMKYIADMEPKDDPKRMWAYGYIGLIYGEIDNVDEGIKYIKKALRIDSNVAALHMLLAGGYQKKGDNWGTFWEGVEALRLKALGY